MYKCVKITHYCNLYEKYILQLGAKITLTLQKLQIWVRNTAIFKLEIKRGRSWTHGNAQARPKVDLTKPPNWFLDNQKI